MIKHLNKAELEAGLDQIKQSPKNNGTLHLIVRRPEENAREVLETGTLSTTDGLVGDMWKRRKSRRTKDGSAHPDMQLNIINSRLIEHVAQDPNRWKLAGDQLYVDMDLSKANLPAGTQLKINNCIIEVTPQPHTGCKKFIERFGRDAMIFVNSEVGKKHQLRGINAKVIKGGEIVKGATVVKVE